MKKLDRNLGFGIAFEEIKSSSKELGMRLPQWSEDVVVKIQRPDEHSKMTAPYLYIESKYGRVPWKENIVEMFIGEWEVVEI
ncbi:TPA: hypothetical protein KNO10_002158 [Clostridioides difficile]|uniref:hypothetical protein n=1 Tax=Clostridioides difficile TaxID=1496 RepID=UPI00038D73DF|nr:hypothetical protein [Clostridioides difficile]EQG38341.1 hypothetical protein QIO_0541 [Clostridioides difficile DA00129]SJQ30659.1 Uncharacterised protein [Clostridioides difficile]SJR41723.1 Uncharacterised protein [Clostridioides difficile]HBF0262859.1 hypothetical protein [Clostridioides difficile]HBF0729006.1 hypothetical protein [Clostridioides difficile]